MIQLYKPTAKNTGMAISLQASDRDKHLYLNMIKQASWDDARKKGSFIENRNKPGFYTTVKFNQIEAGSIIDAIERFDAFKAFHGSEKRNTQINFGPAEGRDGQAAPPLFVLRVSQSDIQDSTQKASFFISLSYGEARLIKEYLLHYLHKSFKNDNYQSKPKEGVQEQSTTEPAESTEVGQQAPTPKETVGDGVDW